MLDQQILVGLHWDVHGSPAMSPLQDAEQYWARDDALFRSEIYCPGAIPVELIQKYAGELEIYPPTVENPYWSRLTTWWNDWDNAGIPPRARSARSK